MFKAWVRLICILFAVIHLPVCAIDFPKDPILRIEAGMHTGSLLHINADRSGRYAVTASDDKTARVWDIKSGELLQVLRPPIGVENEGKLYCVAISPDGKTVAVGGWTSSEVGYTVYLFERSSGRLIRRLMGLPSVANRLVFSADGEWLVATLGFGGVRIWSITSLALPLQDNYAHASHGIGWGQGGKFATTSFDGYIRLYHVSGDVLRVLVMIKAPGGAAPVGIAFSPDGHEIAIGYSDSTRVDILDADSLSIRHTARNLGREQGNLEQVDWSVDGSFLLAGGAMEKSGRTSIRRWPAAGRGTPTDIPTSIEPISSIQALPDGSVLVGAIDPTWGRVHRMGSADEKWEQIGPPPIANLKGGLGGNGFATSTDGKQMQFAFDFPGKDLYRFDVAKRSLIAGRDKRLNTPLLKGIDVNDWATNVPSVAHVPIRLERYESGRSLAIAHNRRVFVLGSDFSLQAVDSQGKPKWRKVSPGAAWSVNIPPSGKIVIAAYGDGTIRWHRLSDGQELLAFFPHADRKRWVLWTPTGYYDASPGGEELIGWHVNRSLDEAADFFPASRFRDRFYRPDIIDRVLDTLDEGQAVAQANEARGSRPQATQNIAQVLPPVVELMSSAELSTASPQVTLRVRGRSAADAPVTGWRIRVNGQAVADARGLGRQDSAAPGGERELTVTIPAHNSEIQVFAENRHGVSTPATLRVAWTAAVPPPAIAAAQSGGAGFQIQPKLYVLAVGVANYQHADINKLALSAKDAKDFAAAMQRQQGKLYRQVEVRLLTDGQATRDEIVDGLEWLQKQVTQHDVGMVFFAGHGVNDAALGYTFLPVNADPDRLKRTGVTVADVRTTLSSMAGKAVAFIDSCHAGNVLGQNRRGASDVGAAISELASAENGVVVFSSSTGKQFSLENPAWGNGAFTLALVEGINGKAAQAGGSRITFKMLDLYISERVKSLTKGDQSPVTQAPGGVPDFPLAMK